MKRENMDLFEFQRRLSTEDACREFLYHQRWPDGLICPRCGCKEYSEVRRPGRNSFLSRSGRSCWTRLTIPALTRETGGLLAVALKIR